jgi:uncharacterized protein with von Willebrand factor type A (vWA) domain
MTAGDHEDSMAGREPDGSPGLPDLIVQLGRQLRRRRLSLGLDDYAALRHALAAGFGWSSHEELSRLCVALWAKSPEEAEIVRAAVSRSGLAAWNLEQQGPDATDVLAERSPAGSTGSRTRSEGGEQVPQAVPVGDLAAVPPSIGAVDRSLVLVPQYPLTEREVAQAWRRLRRWLRSGPAVELDVAATLTKHSRHGIATPPVLVPRRRNTARLLLLIDRFGSMTPFHGYVDHVVQAIRAAGRIDDVRVAYFHDVPGSVDRSILERLDDPFRTDLDAVLPLIGPMRNGAVYADPELTAPSPLAVTLDEMAAGTATVIVSDAGAARRHYDVIRLLDTVALLKALRTRGATVTWLNPAPPDNWPRTTAAEVHRYVPMYPLTREGLDRAIDGLRGRPAAVERLL